MTPYTFDKWFNELQGFTMRSDRFIDEAKAMDVSDRNIKRLIQWLESAYNGGYDQRGSDDSPED